jgi:ATP-dependent protease ClpP protease subunit
LGIAASAASLVLQAGRTRYMAPHSWLMVHEHRTLLPEVASSELKREARLSARLDEQLLRIYERRAKLSRRRLRKLLAEEGWLSATEAVRLGLADRIMEVRHG